MVGGLPTSSLWNIEYDDLLFKELIGKGNFGCVHRGSYLGVEVAIKKITMFDDAEYCKYTEREVKALRYIRHPLVVHFFGACRHETGFYLITEFIEGLDLRRYLKSTPKPPRWISRINIALGVAKTFLFLHSKGILHRDLKSKNILLDISRNQIKICDFGFARVGSQYSNGSDSSSSEDESDPEITQTEAPYQFNGNGKSANYRLRRMSICGTPSFMAPEVLLQQKYDWSIDVFSFGILMSELITLKRPGKDYWIRNANNGFDINQDELNSNIPTPNDCPIQFYDLCLKCCSYKNINRPKFSDIVNILESIKDQLEQQDNNNNNSNNIMSNNSNSNNNILSNSSNNIKKQISFNLNNSNNSIFDKLTISLDNSNISGSSNNNNNNNNSNCNNNNNNSTNIDKSLLSTSNNSNNSNLIVQSQQTLQVPTNQQTTKQQNKINKLFNSNFDSSITTYPISVFKERKKQSFNKLLRVNTQSLQIIQNQQPDESTINNNNSNEQKQQQEQQEQYDREGVIKLNTNQFVNGWKEFNIDSSIQKIWIIYQSNIIKINQSSQQQQQQQSNLIEIICCNILKLKKHSITIGVIDCNLFNGCNIINVKPYIKEYPHLPKLIKINHHQQQQQQNNQQLNSITLHELKLIIQLQSKIRGWLVRRRYKIFKSNWKLNNINTSGINQNTWIKLFSQLIDSEFTYKRQLDQVIKSYLFPIQSKFRINKPLLNYKEIGSIFSNIESLSEIHNELLKIVNEISKSPFYIMNFEINENDTIQQQQQQLQQQDDQNSEFKNVSINTKNSSNQINSITQFIVKNISQIKNQYGIYAFNFKYATNILNWCKLNPDLVIFLESIRVQLNRQFPEEENDLSSLLSLPINKIQKYLSVFEKLQQITPITHSEYNDIKTAYNLIKETSNYIQSQLEMSFEHSHIMSIDIMLQRKDNISLVQSGRWFVKQGLFESSSNSNKQYYVFLLSDICLITKPIKSKSHHHHHSHKEKDRDINISSNNNLSNYKNKFKSNRDLKEDLVNSLNTGIISNSNGNGNGANSKENLINKKYYYRLRETLNLKDEITMEQNPDLPNGIICSIPNKTYKWSLPSEEDVLDWIEDFNRSKLLINRNQPLPSMISPIDQNEINQIHHINNQTISTSSSSSSTATSTLNDKENKGILKRFRLSFSAGTPDRKPTLYQIHSSSSLTSNSDNNSSSSNNNSPTTPIKSVLSSPSINYTPLNNTNGNNDQQQPQPDFQFLVPTTPSDKKKKRNSISTKIKNRLSNTFNSSPVSENKKNRDLSKE